MVRIAPFLQGLAISTFLITSASVWADQLPASGPQSDAKEFAAAYGLTPDSKHYRRLMERARREQQGRVEEDDDVKSYEKRGVIAHLRGEAGIPFSERKPASFDPSKFSDADLQFIATKAVEVANMYAQSAFRGKDLGACVENRSIKEKINIGEKELQDVAIVDVLFIDKKLMPSEPELVFGENVMLQPYEKVPNNPALHLALGYGIECLPSRIMITGKQFIRYEGKPALKNYTKNPNGKGKIVKLEKGGKGKRGDK